MIPSNAALVEEYWEPLLVLQSEQRQVAGREPLSEQRSAGRPGYSGESQLHLHRHRAPISATQPLDIPLTDIRATHSRAMDTPPIRAMGIRVMDTPAAMHIALTDRLCDE